MLPLPVTLLFTLACSQAVASSSPTGQLQGTVVDVSGGSIPNATITLIRLPREPRPTIHRLRTGENGTFLTAALPAGTYSLAARGMGFRRNEIQVNIAPGSITKLDNIALDIASCDSPGVICCDFGISSPAQQAALSPLASGQFTLQANCAVNLDQSLGTATCGKEKISSQAKANLDLRLVREADSLYLATEGGAAIALLTSAVRSCAAATYSLTRLPAAGLGRGDDFCVRTSRGAVSHVFCLDETDDTTKSAAFKFVTRRAERR